MHFIAIYITIAATNDLFIELPIRKTEDQDPYFLPHILQLT